MKKEKKTVAVCVALIWLCGLIAIGFMLLLFLKMNETNIDLFSVAFVCTYMGIMVIVCPSAIIFSKTMKRTKYNQCAYIY